MKNKLWLLVVFFPMFTVAQTPEEMEANYARRIKMEMIDGVYIPMDLEDALSELERLSEPAGIARFKEAPEKLAARRLHFGLGRWILINWGLEDGSRISHYLKERGIHHPDDMVRTIILSWHRKLNGVPIDLEGQVAEIAKRIEEEKKARAMKGDTIVIERRSRE